MATVCPLKRAAAEAHVMLGQVAASALGASEKHARLAATQAQHVQSDQICPAFPPNITSCV